MASHKVVNGIETLNNWYTLNLLHLTLAIGKIRTHVHGKECLRTAVDLVRHVTAVVVSVADVTSWNTPRYVDAGELVRQTGDRSYEMTTIEQCSTCANGYELQRSFHCLMFRKGNNPWVTYITLIF